jgi:hypothetical protein
MDLVRSFLDFKTQMFANPSPWWGGIIGGSITGGLFGWIAHGRSIRPVLVFLRDPEEKQPRWKIQNVGAGPALNIRIRDYENTTVKNSVHAYPLMPGAPRSIAWVSGGDRLEADYTDAYGRRRYMSIGENNATTYKRRLMKIWFLRPTKNYLQGYKPEIHELRKLDQSPP